MSEDEQILTFKHDKYKGKLFIIRVGDQATDSYTRGIRDLFQKSLDAAAEKGSGVVVPSNVDVEVMDLQQYGLPVEQ